MKRFRPAYGVVAALLLGALASCGGRGGRSVRGSQDGLSGRVRENFVRDSSSYAAGLAISRQGDVVKVDVRDPWDSLKVRQRYWLVPRGAASDSLCRALERGGTVVKVPVERAAVYTSVHASMAFHLGAMDRVRGVCEPQYMTSDAVRQRVKDGSLSDYGSSTAPNIEQMMADRVDVIIASPFEHGGYGAAEKLGVPIVEAADYMERLPLGRTAWIRLFGLLFGAEEKAEALLAERIAAYDALKALAATVPASERPTVMLERKYGQSWFVPSQHSYIGTLHRDAAADYLFSDVDDADSRPMAFEQVYKRAADAQFWFLKYAADRPMTYDLLQQEYAPYANFAPFRNRSIYACNTLSSSYYDDITLYPDRILADFISIYHPQLLPGHRLTYYFPLAE